MKYFSNITYGPDRAAEEIFSLLPHSGVFCLAEVHAKMRKREASLNRKLPGIHNVVGPAEQSDQPVERSLGGT